MNQTTMTNTHCLGPGARIPFGEGRQFEVEGILIAVFRFRDGRVRAIQAQCPHRDGRLADGLAGGETLVCPLHGWKFNLTTGEAILGDCGIQTYRAWLDKDDNVWVEFAGG
jgi:nitrite reductase (NADH) small subunit